MSRFVRPDTCTLTLANGDTLLVKRQLTCGEQRAAFARMYLTGGEALKVNPLLTGIGMIVAYLIDWSLTDDDGRRVDIRGLSVEALTAVIDGLDGDSFLEMKAAIEAHELAMIAERQRAKNDRDGGTKLPATSPSLDAAAGGLSGFEPSA